MFINKLPTKGLYMSIYVTMMYMFTYLVTFIYKSLVSCQFSNESTRFRIGWIRTLYSSSTSNVEYQAAGLLNAGTVLRVSLVPLVSGELKFYWASSTSNALARMGEWYNQLVIHTVNTRSLCYCALSETRLFYDVIVISCNQTRRSPGLVSEWSP